MIDAIGHLMLGGILSTPILAAYAIVVSVLICKRKHAAWVFALVIAGISVSFICIYASPANEFAGEIAAFVSFWSLLIGIPIVLIVAMLSGKPSRPTT